MQIVIFDDDTGFRSWMETVVKTFIAGKRITLALSTGDKGVLESFISRNEAQTVFFLDLVISEKLEGLEIAEKIKDKNTLNYISFITQYPSMVMYASKSKLLSSNVILKGNKNRMQFEINKTLEYLYHASYSDVLTIKDRYSTIYRFLYQDIVYIEAEKGVHRISIAYQNGLFNCPGSLKALETTLDDRFMRCHSGFIVNTERILSIDRTKGFFTMSNGSDIPFSRRNRIKLESFYGNI